MCVCVCVCVWGGGVCTCACVCGVCVSLVPRRSGGGANACLCMRLISEKIGYFSDLPRNFYANFIAGSVHAVK